MYSAAYEVVTATLSLSGFSVVKLATERISGKEFAVKIMALPDPGRPVNDYESTQVCRCCFGVLWRMILGASLLQNSYSSLGAGTACMCM